ncbi:MAG: hypothetical protein ACLQVW_20565, partial [Limisphaerales bacterium]
CGFNKSAVLRPRDPRSGNSSFLSNLLRSTSPRLLFYKPTPWASTALVVVLSAALLAVTLTIGGELLVRGAVSLIQTKDPKRPTFFDPAFLFDPARHGKNYNIFFCDGQIAGMNPWVLFNPTNTAAMWNTDHQPHPELWVP